MNHWQMIAIAYGLTFAVLAIEVVLLGRRRRAALRQVPIGDASEREGE